MPKNESDAVLGLAACHTKKNEQVRMADQAMYHQGNKSVFVLVVDFGPCYHPLLKHMTKGNFLVSNSQKVRKTKLTSVPCRSFTSIQMVHTHTYIYICIGFWMFLMTSWNGKNPEFTNQPLEVATRCDLGILAIEKKCRSSSESFMFQAWWGILMGQPPIIWWS